MEIKSYTENSQMIIERCYGSEERVALPEQIEGVPVAAIAPYAFSEAKPGEDDTKRAICGQQLREIVLPESLRRIGSYAFYGCRLLEHLTLYHQLEDIAGGAFTGCHRLRELYFYMEGARGYCLKDIVGELRQELQITLDYGKEGKAILLFSEYYEEAVENTPARILETHFHGSGYHYRQCFRDGEFQYQEYDSLFSEAVAWESTDFCIELALMRLQHPYRLSKTAEGCYMSWLIEQRMEAASWCIAFEQNEALEFISSFIEWSAKELDVLIQEANYKNRMEIQSFLLDYKHRNIKKTETSFEL